MSHPNPTNITTAIVDEGPNVPRMTASPIDPDLAGRYVVTHGSFTLGHPGGGRPPVIAHVGATVDLSAIDAYNALAVGTVKRAT